MGLKLVVFVQVHNRVAYSIVYTVRVSDPFRVCLSCTAARRKAAGRRRVEGWGASGATRLTTGAWTTALMSTRCVAKASQPADQIGGVFDVHVHMGVLFRTIPITPWLPES